ncbi:hypothetical protein [Elioraea sp.]|uniref:hypothetical protein n=1 Tax=Elioraea sp. TaxID=2185103 RepID=UPI0021DCFF45|nr:hypothetical protein [Elioraea sp.]GIX11555.1 MAG: hypothetical protein KatS3mg116_3265 [Elioraea sp.]
MTTKKLIIKFEDAAEQVHGSVRRIVGFVQAKSLLGLFDAVDLEANPRSAKWGQVTEAIVESINRDADIFPFKTKGVLVGSSDYQALERKRYELRFSDPATEGILDGGHNMLAIGSHIIFTALGDEKVTRKIKNWETFKDSWRANREAIEAIREELSFLVPIEILVPADLDDDAIVSDFRSELLEICAARNNNAELTLETKANQKGFYEAIKAALPDSVAKRIEWKSNMAGGDIKVRDIIALSWIPLSLIPDLPVKAPAPQNLYRNKGECAKLFDDLMSHETISERGTDGPTYTLKSEAVRSAIQVLGDLPALYDKIYAEFPDAYNKAGGHFGRIGIVRMYDPSKRTDKNRKYMRTQPSTHFTEQDVEYSYPDALIMPLVWALRVLMEFKDGKVRWRVNPTAFLDRHLIEIARNYKLVLEMSRFDPNKLGKNEASYGYAVTQFETALLKQEKAAA